MEYLYLLIICDEPAAPDGAPPRRISVYTYICKHRTAPPCLGEALRRGILLKLHGLMIFMVWVRTIPFMPVSSDPKILMRRGKTGIQKLLFPDGLGGSIND